MSTIHRPKVERGTDHVGVVFRMRCTCGTSGADQPTRGLARRDFDAHLTALPLVPDHQRCRFPREHDCREWEPCEMCEHQLALFDLGDVA